MKIKFSIRFLLLFVMATAVSIFVVQRYWAWKYDEKIVEFVVKKSDFGYVTDFSLNQTAADSYEISLNFQTRETFGLGCEGRNGPGGQPIGGVESSVRIEATDDENGLQIKAFGGSLSGTGKTTILSVESSSQQVDDTTFKIMLTAKQANKSTTQHSRLC